MDYCDNKTLEKFESQSSGSLESVVYLYKVFVPILLAGCMLSLILNLVLVIVGTITQSKSNRSRSPILLLSLNLAATDSIASFLMGFGLLVNSFLPVVLGINISNLCFKLTLEIFRLSALIASALHLLALALVHYKGIVNPLHYRSVIFCSQHRTRSIYLTSFICWLLPSVVIASYFGSIPCQGFQHESCRSDFILTFRFRIIIVVAFFIPLVLMFYFYIRIFAIITRHQKQRALNQHKSYKTSVQQQISNSSTFIKNNNNNIKNNDHTLQTSCSNDHQSEKQHPTDSMTIAKEHVSSSNSTLINIRSASSTMAIVDENDGLDDNDQLTQMTQTVMLNATTTINKNDLIHQHDDSSTPSATTILCRKQSIKTTAKTTDNSLIHKSESNLHDHNNSLLKKVLNLKFFTDNSKNGEIEPTEKHDSSTSFIDHCINEQDCFFQQQGRYSKNQNEKTINQRVKNVFEEISMNASIMNHQDILIRIGGNSSSIHSIRCKCHGGSSGNSKALITTLSILGTYVLCWMPAVLFFALTCIDECYYPINTLNYRMRVIFSFITNGLVILKAIVDPFIYTYRMKEMKTALKKWLYYICPFNCVRKFFPLPTRMAQQQNSTRTENSSTRMKKLQLPLQWRVDI